MVSPSIHQARDTYFSWFPFLRLVYRDFQGKPQLCVLVAMSIAMTQVRTQLKGVADLSCPFWMGLEGNQKEPPIWVCQNPQTTQKKWEFANRKLQPI